mmetsp:Transcript_41855/g.110876  ORF Transcript_41855/g.110876 Transcript_41855/m.110876 type:complete len:228 (+) Transcript_41855:470-1153(+)
MRIALKRIFMSTPHFFATIIASPMAQSCTAQSMLVRILMTVSCPKSPHLTIRGADNEIRGFTRLKVSSSEPTNATILPAFKICMPPVTGAATALAPRFSTSALTLMVFSKSVVECSIHTAPGCKPARRPSGDTCSPLRPIAAETFSGLGNPVKITSQRSANSRGDAAQDAPCFKNGMATPCPLMSYSTGERPARSRLPVTARPNCPMPTMPTLPGAGQAIEGLAKDL